METKSETAAEAELKRYVYDFDPRTVIIPKRIDPAYVARFVARELQPAHPERGQAQRLVELADFYAASEVVPAIRRWLDPSGKDREGLAVLHEGDLVAALELDRGLAILGGERDRADAAQHYLRLLASPGASDEAHAVLACLDELVSPALVTATDARFDAGVRELRARNDPNATTRALDLDDVRRLDLVLVAGAATYRADIAATPERERRLARLTDIYLGLALEYYEHVFRWSVRMLQREAVHDPGAVVRAWRAALVRIAAEPEPDRQAPRAHALLAIDFFGASLTRAEQAELSGVERRFAWLALD